jgi:glyoxylase-like metal-dependent hydrolase (beta-lactamase superfamily II)
MCSSLLTLKCYFLTLSPDTVARESSCMVHKPDVILPDTDGPVDFAGARFTVLQTPGHSAGHIAVITPDNVCYTADALLSREMLYAKLPYALSLQMATVSREKLRGLGCEAYLMAHRGVCGGEEIDALIDENHALCHQRTQEILSLVTAPMTESQIVEAACTQYRLLTHRPRRALRYERNVRFFIEYLVDRGELEMECRQGVTLYHRRQGT